MAVPRQYRTLLSAASRRYRIPPHILAGLIEVESGWNPNAVSSAGAFGLTQFMPGTAKGIGVRRGDPRSQILGAAKYLSQLGYHKNRRLALASYNAGPGNPGAAGNYPEKVLGAAKRYKGLDVGDAAARRLGITVPGSETPDREVENPRYKFFDTLDRLNEASGEHDPLVQSNYELMKSLISPTVTRPGTQIPGMTIGSMDFGGGSSKVKDGGGYRGTQGVVKSITKGFPSSSEKRDKKYTSSGGISDHWVGNKNSYAQDIPARGPQGDKIARTVARRLGWRDWKPGSYARKVVNIRGRKYSVQLLWRVAGHYDHVHVGVQRI